jgi:glycosyltransferase involved in cell wall biosynthesis
MQFPKVLIIGQSFNKKTGGGVTLTNLFTGWPVDKIAVTSNSNMAASLDTTVCSTYYQLGYNGKMHPFPLNLVLPKVYTGLLPIQQQTAVVGNAHPTQGGKFKHIYKILTMLLHFTGLYNVFYKVPISDDFAKWLKAYNPDVIYAQMDTLESIKLTGDIQKLTNKPLVIHMMDDWPTTVSKPGILYWYWKKVIDKEFRKLLSRCAVLMSIGDAMSDEYKERYGHAFVPFHNPIDVNFWKPATVKDYTVKNKFTILYAGRIGFGIESSIIEIAQAVEAAVATHPNIVFEIQTPDGEALAGKVNIGNNIKLVTPTAYSELPAKFSGVDLLLLPQDFDNKSVNFLRYSYPTKASEYMISGTPILVYGSTTTGLTQHALKYKWGYVVVENNKEALVKAILDLYENGALKQQLAKRAQEYAMANEDAVKVREKFKQSLILAQNTPVSL